MTKMLLHPAASFYLFFRAPGNWWTASSPISSNLQLLDTLHDDLCRLSDSSVTRLASMQWLAQGSMQADCKSLFRGTFETKLLFQKGSCPNYIKLLYKVSCAVLSLCWTSLFSWDLDIPTSSLPGCHDDDIGPGYQHGCSNGPILSAERTAGWRCFLKRNDAKMKRKGTGTQFGMVLPFCKQSMVQDWSLHIYEREWHYCNDPSHRNMINLCDLDL